MVGPQGEEQGICRLQDLVLTVSQMLPKCLPIVDAVVMATTWHRQDGHHHSAKVKVELSTDGGETMPMSKFPTRPGFHNPLGCLSSEAVFMDVESLIYTLLSWTKL